MLRRSVPASSRCEAKECRLCRMRHRRHPFGSGLSGRQDAYTYHVQACPKTSFSSLSLTPVHCTRSSEDLHEAPRPLPRAPPPIRSNQHSMVPCCHLSGISSLCMRNGNAKALGDSIHSVHFLHKIGNAARLQSRKLLSFPIRNGGRKSIGLNDMSL
jgi:hypothetical protein